MLRTILLGISMSFTIGIYYPMWKRILKRKATRDYSKMSQWFITGVQVNGFLLATAEHAPYLQLWYVTQTILCLTTLYFIYRHWNNLPPLMRGEQNGKAS